jgi:hypothetical protein
VLPVIKFEEIIPEIVAVFELSGYNNVEFRGFAQFFSFIIDRVNEVDSERMVEMVPFLLVENTLPKVADSKKAIPVVRLVDTAVVIDEGEVDVDSTSDAVELQVIAEQCLFCGDVNFTACGHCHKYRKGN